MSVFELLTQSDRGEGRCPSRSPRYFGQKEEAGR